jgi:hypothetical protein
MLLQGITIFGRCKVEAAIIDTAEIEVAASGSLNTISGSGTISNHFFIPDNATFEFFSVELSDFWATEPIGLPNGLSIGFQHIDPFSSGNLPFRNPFIGQQVIVSQAENRGAYDKMIGYLSNSGEPPPFRIITTMSWPFGGIRATAYATFFVVAQGEITPIPPPIPIPSSFWLLGTALIGIIGFRKKFKK